MNNLQHERISVLAQDLRLTALPDLYGGIAQNAANKKDVSYADFLEDVLKAERDARRVRSREILTRTAGFPALKTLETYDFTFATGAPHSQIQELASLGFVERAENIVLLGPSGTGKTHLAIAFGLIALLRYEAAEALHGLGDAFLVGRNDLAQILRVHASGERRRTDEVREHHRDLAALGAVFWMCAWSTRCGRCVSGGRLTARVVTQSSDGIQQLAPVP